MSYTAENASNLILLRVGTFLIRQNGNCNIAISIDDKYDCNLGYS